MVERNNSSEKSSEPPKGAVEISSRLRGVYTALATPFTEDSRNIDYASIDVLLDQQISAGISGLVIAGSTGEAATLSDVEFGALVRYIVDRSEARLCCIVGVNSSSTVRAVELAQRASDSGADGLLVVTPPYNKPSQAGIVQHFEEIYRATHKPIIAYNVPGRAVSSLTPQTYASLAQEGVVIGLKESSGSVDSLMDFLATAPKGNAIFCGDDSLYLASLAHGAAGLISVLSNVAPASLVRLSAAAFAGDYEQARLIHFELLPLMRTIYMESNPIPVKAALKLKGLIKSSSLRLPLMAAQDATTLRFQQIFAERAFE